ncbi:sushi, von Willebrand factor type A, EGF and pentraxin domain-containing protein 1-like isoform X3 [Hermetia illucens]|uniref:sushi, von Willebrand factor type A, EGF and pentraxin domain-containing protein 1-like isoform X3 n=1 Tax=Hermetia illucens TaxID=343691 RepID=UPI0018CC437B|nr:sushi, von Willebrand factor type A, EGF and pentraxin domain-containing protein 1-like isoform X3 [Hermetia illucens]
MCSVIFAFCEICRKMKFFLIISCYSVVIIGAEIFIPDLISRLDANPDVGGDISYTVSNHFGGKFLKPISGDNFENAVYKSNMGDINRNFKTAIDDIKRKAKRVDMVFLIDSSSSVGKENFISETKFVKKLLSDFNVSYNYTRVALVTYSSQGKVIRQVDQISEPSVNNDKCTLLNDEIPQIEFVAGGTYTYGALEEAKKILINARKNSKKIIFLVTDGYSNGKDPVPIATKLKESGVTIFTIGIQSGNYIELYNISSAPEEGHSFLLDSFSHFESLARKALHADYKIGFNVKLGNQSKCDGLCENQNKTGSCCDVNADCTCGTSTGHYTCQCFSGYYGSGLKDQCFPCPNGTYWHNSNMCRPCPDINHITIEQPALNVSYCVCKTGFKQTEDNRCEGITCPKLSPPQNGYFVKQPTSCANVLNAACGARCKSGYQLTGTSLRLCQENGTWSGTEATCVLKTCPSLLVPFYGLALCRNKDLNLFFDYSPRNSTFMKFYDIDSKRVTEPMPIDTDCTFKCGPGYYLVGSRSRTCLPLAKWDGLQTTCKQILCSPLPKPTYGSYEFGDCTEQKVPHGTNCTLLCPEGFTVRGPETKTCAGKKNGIWTHKNKNAKCVDITPPHITCPENISVFVEESNDYTIIKTLPIPTNMSDSSGRNVTYWLKQNVNITDGVKLNIGNHTFTYIASDPFNNKANCSFIVQVIDKVPPVAENCIDPEEYRVRNTKTEFIEWEEPTFFDNSNTEVIVQKSLSPGILGEGLHKAVYTAFDKYGNNASCSINITVKEMFCDTLKPPLNGNILCARNITYTWCELICNPGYAVFDSITDDYQESLNLTCLNESPDWKVDSTPDCTPLELPNSVEQILTIPVDSDNVEPICGNETKHNDLQKILIDHLKKYMCNELEECELVSNTPPECTADTESTEDIDNEINGKTYYKVFKREIQPSNEDRKQRVKQKYNIRIKLYTRIGRKLGVWKKGKTLAENLQTVRNELHSVSRSEDLKKRLQSLNIDVRRFKIEEFLKCSDGSIFKKHMCVQCPRGTFQDALFNRCVTCPIGTYNSQLGQILCTSCPPHTSTRKGGRRHIEDCIQQCPPGTAAKIKIPRKKLRPEVTNTHSLMPFCRKCNPGEYQSEYDQTQCEKCPSGHTSPRGATSRSECTLERPNPCIMNPKICGPNGVCITDSNVQSSYYCQCDQGFDGPHCEHAVDLCVSAPCFNHGSCNKVNATTVTCTCPLPYTGQFCEEIVSPCVNSICHNGGTCLEVAGSAMCECLTGFDGTYCEKKVDYCRHNLCENGRCENIPDGYQCKCPPGIIGKRCHLRPCDYLPCHKNAICIDLPHFPATQESYMCKCPIGLRGYDCAQSHNPCDVRPCRNNGVCTPKALRVVGSSDLNEEKYREYTCKCPPYFYGKNCEILVTPDFYMKFSKPSTTNYAKLEGPAKDLKEISFCTWIQTNDSFNYGTIISYATLDMDNMFTFTDYNGFVLYVHGQHIVTDITINDGIWHFICVAWTSNNGYYEIYLDGKLLHAGLNLSANSVIEKGGILIIGQEQDQLNGDFSESESFVGNIAYFDIWDTFITAAEIKEFHSSCEPYRGNLYAWTDFKMGVHGAIEILPSNFCKPCKSDLNLANGRVNIVHDKAFHQCDEGYKLHGNVMRKCLRTSEWSPGIPYCQIVTCRPLPDITMGAINYTSLTYGGFAKHTCHDGYLLEGNPNRICLSNGEWSGMSPVCISKVRCPPIEISKSASISYGTESGPLNSTLKEYDVGAFAEIVCNVEGNIVESITVCMDSGEWDIKVPACAAPRKPTSIEVTPTTTTKIPMSRGRSSSIYRFIGRNVMRATTRRPTTTSTTQKSISATSSTTTSATTTKAAPKLTTKPTTMKLTTKSTTMRSTTKSTTVKLTTPSTTVRSTLKPTVTTSTTTTPKTTTTTTTTTSTTTSTKPPKPTPTTPLKLLTTPASILRFTTGKVTEHSEDTSSLESQEDYLLRTSTEFYDEVLTTLNMEHCNLKDAPEPPSNGLIVNVLSSENRTIIIDLESLRHNPIFIPELTLPHVRRAEYGIQLVIFVKKSIVTNHLVQ